VTVAVSAGTGGYGSAQAFSDGFGPALVVAAALAAGGAVAALGLPGRHRAAVPRAVPALEEEAISPGS
jgi:hypothetical protein